MRRFTPPALALATCLLVATSIAGAQAPARTTVTAAGYAEGVRFIEADERAFLDPVAAGIVSADEPPRLDVAPDDFVPRVEVRSVLWAGLAAGAALGAVEDVADYDTETATVRLRHLDGTASWWALDEARAAMLTRYARIGRAGRTGPEPTTLQVLREMRRWRESVVIDVEGFALEPRRWDQRLLWNEFERAVALDVTPADVPWSPSGPTEPLFFVGAGDEAAAGAFDLSLDALDGGEGVHVTFRLLDGRALPFVYLRGPSLLVDVTRLETNRGARVLALPAFEVSPTVAITLDRIVASEGAPLADGANERLADGLEPGAPPAPAATSAPAAVAPTPAVAPAPRVVRSFNEAARVVVTNVNGGASTFVAMLLALATVALAGAVVRRV